MVNLTKIIESLPSLIQAHLESRLSKETQSTLLIRGFSLARVPLLFLTSPKVNHLDDSRCELTIPFRKIVKNHLGSMYFGALAIGADACVGLIAVDKIRRSGHEVNLIFKDFQINFLKRAEATTRFVCDQGDQIQEMLDETISTGERVNKTLAGKAFCNDVEVADFRITLSLKKIN